MERKKSKLSAIQGKALALYNHYESKEENPEVLEAWQELIDMLENEGKLRHEILDELSRVIGKI